MKLNRLSPDPMAVVGFYDEALGHLGALCERTWHDRLHVVAEGPAARLWNADGSFVEAELHFPEPESTAPRDAAREVFPGCPLTFRLAELLCPSALLIERGVLKPSEASRPPAADTAEKHWQAQHGAAPRWRLESSFAATWTFVLLWLVRCEVQAMDQHWSLHRLALSLPDGEPDPDLERSLDFVELTSSPSTPVPWPSPEPAAWGRLLAAACQRALGEELAPIRERQEHFLRRELDRIDDYFAGYERELRGRRTRTPSGRLRLDERLAAARAEHQRRREDQIRRHEILVVPHADACVLMAEPAWLARVGYLGASGLEEREAMYLPRTRRWVSPELGTGRKPGV